MHNHLLVPPTLWLVVGLAVVVGVTIAMPAAAVSLQIPSTKVVFPNGLTVVVAERHKLPLTTISIRIKAGSAYDPDKQAGLADLTARLLDKGTQQRSATQIAEAIDFLGAQLSTGAGGTGSTLALALLAKDSERGLALLADLLQQPQFDSAELEREQGQMLSEIQQRRVDPHQVVFETFRALFFAGHPLGHPVSGYPETVSQLTRGDVLAFHRRYYVPANTIVVMVGDLSETQMREWLERYLGGWQATAAAPVALPQPKPLQEKQVRMVDLEVNQSYLQFGLRAVRRADPEFVTLRALNYILGGGGFVSRLMRVIREEQGLAYSVASEVVGLSELPGYLTVALETRIETTAHALTSMFAVLERLKQEPVTTEELADMKQFFASSLPHRAETYGQVAELLLDREFYGLPDGYWASEIEQIQHLTVQDLHQAAQRHLHTERFVLAVVSRRAQVDLTHSPIPVGAITYAPPP